MVEKPAAIAPFNNFARLYDETRARSLRLCRPLQTEDFLIQAADFVSPTKWHLAHTSWFFEHFLLKNTLPHYRPYSPKFDYLFNSYYQTVGKFVPRTERGLLSRPLLSEVYAYRDHVDAAMAALFDRDLFTPENHALLELGVAHEEQHQELILMDILYNFSRNPLFPAYQKNPVPAAQASSLMWVDFPGGLIRVGQSEAGFAFDNERPAYQAVLPPFRMASRLTTNREYKDFIEAGGYVRSEFWLSDGWDWIQREQISKPLYWYDEEGQHFEMSLAGMKKRDPEAPVSHVSFYEADAYARWKGCRLATEGEWECAAGTSEVRGNFLESGKLTPTSPVMDDLVQQLWGDLWEWTQSPYTAHPGYQPLPGALGEYNGKFMANQLTLKGGSCVTPSRHLRKSYRNFFPPSARWAFSGIRLAGNR